MTNDPRSHIIGPAEDDCRQQLKASLLQAADGLRSCRELVAALPIIEASLSLFHDSILDRLAVLPGPGATPTAPKPAPVPLALDARSPGRSRLLNVKAVAEEIGISVSTINRYRKADDFPRPFRFSDRTVVFDRSEIETWIHQMQGKNNTR